MKRSINNLMLAALALMILAAAVPSIFAQTDDDAKNALYEKFKACYKPKVPDDVDPCIAIGKDYLAKYGTPPDDISKFVQAQVDKLPQKKEDLITQAALDKFNKGFSTKNYKDAFDGGKTYIGRKPNEPVSLDIALILATVAYDQAFTGNNPGFKDDGLNMARTALQKIDSGMTSTNWGGTGDLSYKNKDNAVAWMNYTIAKLMADTNKDTAQNYATLKGASPYYFKALQIQGSDFPKADAYVGIGRYYLEEFNKTVDAYEPCKAQTDYTDECKATRGKQLAYAERAANAYAHAYKAASDDPKTPKATKDFLQKKVTDFYNIRFNKNDAASVNDFVAKNGAQPLADPATDVTPVLEDPAATTNTPATTIPAANGTKPPAKPVTPTTTPTTTTKPVTTAAPNKPAGSGKGAEAMNTPAKKKTGK
jgi:hypothetical protein